MSKVSNLSRFNALYLNRVDKKILNNFFERRKFFDQLIKEKQCNLFTCPGCGYPTIQERGAFNWCSICDWEDDGQDDNDADLIRGGPNGSLSLTENRLNIGRKLQLRAKKLGGKVNLPSLEIIKILRDRENELISFREKIPSSTNIKDPLWITYREFKEESLDCLITQ